MLNGLCESQNWRCAYCAGYLSDDIATVSHVVPLRIGGKPGWLNAVAACTDCDKRHERFVIRKAKFDSIDAAVSAAVMAWDGYSSPHRQ
jgi:5-methylcytosine-specific restriction endonuclease McrA